MFVYFLGLVEESWSNGVKYRFHAIEVKLNRKIISINDINESIPEIRNKLLEIYKDEIDSELKMVNILRTYTRKDYEDTLFNRFTVLSFSLLREE